MVNDIVFVKEVPQKCSVVVGVYSDGSLSDSATKLDSLLQNIITKNLQRLGWANCKQFETREFLHSSEEYNHIVLICLGEKDKRYKPAELSQLGVNIYKATEKLDSTICVYIDAADVHMPCSRAPAMIAMGLQLRSWKFDKYISKRKNKAKLEKVQFCVGDVEGVTEKFAALSNIAQGVFLTRSVVAEPANVIYPESFAMIAQQELMPLGVKVEILDENAMRQLGMNAILGVGQGSAHAPKLVVLSWNGSEDAPIAFIGKGVTFDSGGISLKPDDGMADMRYDMAGAGTVLGLLKAVALNELPVHVVGIMALVENMPSGTAQRPGDIVTSMSGQTIEILSTDAEGRLILADALWYAQDRFHPKAMVDLATLTGAIVVALGHEFAGLFSNDDELVSDLLKSAEITGEKLWRMPLTQYFDDGINSSVADMRNLGKPGVRAGSITAAQFLQRFVNGVNWAHLDIAGVADTDTDLFPSDKGATGFGVHLLHNFLEMGVRTCSPQSDAEASGDKSGA